MPRIQEISIEKVDLQLSRPYTIAFKTVNKVENAIVRVILDNGVVGYGSGNPSEQVVGKNLSQTMQALDLVNGGETGTDWKGLRGRNIEDLEVLCSEVQEQLRPFPAARAALEMGLYDSLARCKNVPLVAMLGQQHQRMPTSITIGIKDVGQTLAEATEYYERGFRYLKIKTGSYLEEDIERVVKLREKLGDSIEIRVDANQGYTVADLLKFCAATGSYRVELIEQPLPADHVEQMRALPKEIREQLAADESLINPADAANLAHQDPACGIFNIKLMKCGGITQALEIARIAKGANIDLMWGCNDESVISITAALHTAFSCPNTRYIDLDGSLDLAFDVVSGGFILENGEMSINTSPGLGVFE